MPKEYLIPQFIIDYLQKSRSTKNPQNLCGFKLHKNKTPEIENWFKENEVTASYIWRFFVFYGLNKFSFRECRTCGKRINISTILKRPNSKYCSLSCSCSSDEFLEKRKQTNLKRYGVEYPIQLKEKQEKLKQTCLEKYGVESFSKTEDYKEKCRQTCLEKYGVESFSKTEECKEKYKKTCLEKYGTEYITQTKHFKKLKRSNHWETFCLQLKEKYIIPLFSKEEYVNDTGRKFKCLVCNKEFVSEGTCNYDKEHLNNDGSFRTLQTNFIYCPHCFKARFSKKEKDVLDYIKSIYKGEVLENNRKILEGKELDIYVPSFKLAIEFDGTYWHSSNFKATQKRDKIKTHLCEEKGIKLLRIKEEDWDKNNEKVKEEIKRYFV